MEEKTIENLPLIEKDVFLKELRSVTSPAHKKLEEARLSKVIVSEDLTVEEYASYLGKMALVMSSFEKDIFPLLKPYFSDLCHRNKLALLEKDLNFLSQKITLKQFDFPGFSKITAISLTFKIAKASHPHSGQHTTSWFFNSCKTRYLPDRFLHRQQSGFYWLKTYRPSRKIV